MKMPPPFTKPKYRIGIDVGGTFTHAVAIEARSARLVGKVKVPTTHSSKLGVGEGVIQSLVQLMRDCDIEASQIILVAHSTTQATNSLLEGDVEKVGIVSAGQGIHGWLTRRATRLGKIRLAPGKSLETLSHHIHSALSDPEPALLEFLKECRSQGVRVIVVSTAFSVDDPAQENALAEFIRAQGFMVTATHEISQLYGVRIRTRTTAINASILPKMLEVADHTEREIRKAGITAPFMIMRSDGGIMSVDEMRKKPVLTLLSGPAAGIAAALRYLKISDGIFLEVGGTSTDISVIKNGRAITRTAIIGGNPTFLKTLDCRTIGIGGGSMPRVHGRKIVDVGPRSAHIAGVKYAAFEAAGVSRVGGALRKKFEQPRPGDPDDYLILEGDAPGARFGFTPTCAANALSLVPRGDCARAGDGFPGPFDHILPVQDFSQQLLTICSAKLAKTVNGLIREYKLEPSWITLIGGGGGAAALVPHLAQTLGLKYELAQDADVISAIGVALGLVREVVEKSLINPSAEEIYRIRHEARERVIAQGADPSSVEVFIEVDTKKNLVRAEAQGAIEFRKDSVQADGQIEEGNSSAIARGALGLTIDPTMIRQARSTYLSVSSFAVREKRFFGMSEHLKTYATVLDRRGVVRLKLAGAEIFESHAGDLVQTLEQHLDDHATYDDGGVTYPQIFALLGDRVIDLSKLQSPEHFSTVLGMETKEVPASEPAVLIFSQRNLEEQ